MKILSLSIISNIYNSLEKLESILNISSVLSEIAIELDFDPKLKNRGVVSGISASNASNTTRVIHSFLDIVLRIVEEN